MSATQPLLSKRDEDISGEPASQGYQSINSDLNQGLIYSASSDSVDQGAQRGEETKVYKRRWYLLLLFSLMCGTQGCVWNTFGPISPTVGEAFGWDNGNIGLLTNWGPISFILATGPLIWIMEVKGLRAAGLCSAFFIASGTVARVFTAEPPLVTILMNVGQALNGLAGPVAMAGPPVMSAVWFPPKQRTTATAIGTIFATMGTAAGFVLGPMMVPDVPHNSTLSADVHLDSMEFLLHNQTKLARIEEEKKAILRLMYIECGWACAIFLAMVIYFPKKPPLPPSPSAALQREDFLSGLRRIVCCPQFWVLGVVYGVSQGVLNCWSAILDVLLKPHGIGETTAGWIGFFSIVGGCVFSILISIVADYMKRVMKWFVFLFYVLGTAAFLVFALAASSYIPPSLVLFAVTIVGGTTAVYASTPLMFELVCEAVYPAGEGTANGVLTLMNNVAGGVFLLMMMAPNIGTEWMNWVLVGACAQTLPLLLLLRMRYNRLDLDELNPSLSATLQVPTPPPTPSPSPSPSRLPAAHLSA
ncbi:solute carrier family 49 member 4-like [Babylonia areolata]|uniref:solute carrier family 49 member 4-like n=1 Tax=Babylonia areolata TaxID=304850 RepID=UPI003FD48439